MRTRLRRSGTRRGPQFSEWRFVTRGKIPSSRETAEQREKSHGKRGELARRVLEALQKSGIVRAGERVGVAVSGGVDSVALLFLLEELRERLGIVLSVVHFNHQLRGKQSDADEKFVAKLAASRGLVLHVDHADVAALAKKQRRNLEETGRRLRYEFFARLVNEGRVAKVAVAHTADDQAETVLGHILRGTGLAGLGGIHPTSSPLTGSPQGTVIRPLLEIRRAELRAYLKARRQTWREDVTNRDETRFRVRVRRRLIPLLEKQFQPAAVAHLVTLTELAREDEAFLEALVADRYAALVARDEGSARILAKELVRPWRVEEAAPAVSKRLIRRIVEELKRRPGQLAAQHVDAVLELAQSGQSGKSLNLPGGVGVRRELEALVFYAAGADTDSFGQITGKKTAAGPYAYEIKLPMDEATVCVPEAGCAFRFRVIDWPPQERETSVRGTVLDRTRLSSPLVLRSWRAGDAYRPEGHQRAHKLKRLLLERRVSRWERAGWPVLTSGGTVVWARGFPVAAEFAPTAQTRAGVVIAEE